MRKYKVTYYINGRLCDATYRSAHRNGSQSNLDDAMRALFDHYGEKAIIVRTRKCVPYEPDGLVVS